MTSNSPPDDPESFALWREAQDMSRRTRMGADRFEPDELDDEEARIDRLKG